MTMKQFQNHLENRLNISAIRDAFCSLLSNNEFIKDKNGTDVIELMGISFVADEPTIFGEPNAAYIKREIEWYESCDRNIRSIPGPGKIPQIWVQVAGVNGEIQSNYGWCIWAEENGYQYHHTYRELLARPYSRRAIMIYNRPSMHVDYQYNAMDDFICTTSAQYLIRDKHLHVIVNMRSNDVVYGYRNDFAWQNFVLQKLAGDLNIIPGTIIWQVGSLHLYERHFHLPRDTMGEDRSDDRETT